MRIRVRVFPVKPSIVLYLSNNASIICGETPLRNMSKNVGSVDHVLRTAVGAVGGAASIAILAGTVSLPTVLSPVLGVVAAVMLATAAMGTCPTYSMFGVDSCSRKSNLS